MKRGSAVLLAGLVLMLSAVASPASAGFDQGPREPGVVVRYESPVAAILVDENAGLVALMGPPAERFCLFSEPEFDVGIIQNTESPAGPITHHLNEVLDAWIYVAPSFEDLCANPEGFELLADGQTRVVATDTYWNYEPGGRTELIRTSVHGVVYGTDGDAWNFSGHDTIRIDRNGNFRLLNSMIQMSRRGN